MTAIISCKSSLFKTIDAPSAGSNPQASLTIFIDRKNLVACKSIFLRIALKVIGQKPAQALSKRTYPQAIVPVLVEGADETLVWLVANIANKLPTDRVIQAVGRSPHPQCTGVIKKQSHWILKWCLPLLSRARSSVHAENAAACRNPECSIGSDGQRIDILLRQLSWKPPALKTLKPLSVPIQRFP